MRKQGTRITESMLRKLKPKGNKPYFIRGENGFGVKVNPSGSIKFIVEKMGFRGTVGSYPRLPLEDAKNLLGTSLLSP